MSIPRQDKQSTFFDATFLAQDLFDPTDRYEIFRRQECHWGQPLKYK